MAMKIVEQTNIKVRDLIEGYINDNSTGEVTAFNGKLNVRFLDKYCPEQFEIIGHEHDINGNSGDGIKEGQFLVNKNGKYKRILVRFTQ